MDDISKSIGCLTAITTEYGKVIYRMEKKIDVIHESQINLSHDVKMLSQRLDKIEPTVEDIKEKKTLNKGIALGIVAAGGMAGGAVAQHLKGIIIALAGVFH